MITILLCRIDQLTRLGGLGDYYFKYVEKKKSEEEQFRYILDCDKRNGIIAITAHPNSVLRNYLIKPHLDDNGFQIDGTYECMINGKIIKYKLVSLSRILEYFIDELDKRVEWCNACDCVNLYEDLSKVLDRELKFRSAMFEDEEILKDLNRLK